MFDSVLNSEKGFKRWFIIWNLNGCNAFSILNPSNAMNGTTLGTVLPQSALVLDAVSEIACAVSPERTFLNQN
jgi:hypothetical protein